MLEEAEHTIRQTGVTEYRSQWAQRVHSPRRGLQKYLTQEVHEAQLKALLATSSEEDAADQGGAHGRMPSHAAIPMPGKV